MECRNCIAVVIAGTLQNSDEASAIGHVSVQVIDEARVLFREKFTRLLEEIKILSRPGTIEAGIAGGWSDEIGKNLTRVITRSIKDILAIPTQILMPLKENHRLETELFFSTSNRTAHMDEFNLDSYLISPEPDEISNQQQASVPAEFKGVGL